jgi:hypothetical protein
MNRPAIGPQGSQLARDRQARADKCIEYANAHGMGRWADEYRRQAEFWRKAAQAALSGDTSPVQWLP